MTLKENLQDYILVLEKARLNYHLRTQQNANNLSMYEFWMGMYTSVDATIRDLEEVIRNSEDL